MNVYSDIRFIAGFFLIFVIRKQLLRLAPKLAHPSMIALSLTGIWLIDVSHNTFSATLLFTFCTLIFLLIIQTFTRVASIIQRTSIVLIIGLFVFQKYRIVTSPLAQHSEFLLSLQSFEWIGYSYLLLRSLDLLINASSSKISLMEAANYLTFFPSFISGPIPRAQNFAVSIVQTAESFQTLLDRPIFRIPIGVIKILFLGRFFFNLSLGFFLTDHPAIGSLFELFLRLFAYLLYIYFDFSGYCDCAIAVSKLLGFNIPENFDFPLWAKNIQDFWNRWHISLSEWCRDYIFFPSLRLLLEKTPGIPMLLSTILSTLLTFSLLGSWHGDKLNWLLYGIYHGLGISSQLVYRTFMQTKCPQLYQTLAHSKLYGLVCTAATLSFISIGLLLTLDLKRIETLIAGIK